MQFISSYVYWTWEWLINQGLYSNSHLISMDLTAQPLRSFHGSSTADPKSDIRDNSGFLTVPLWSPGETLMERVHPAEQRAQKKGLVSGWNPCLAAKSSLHCRRARSSVAMCNLTLWGDSPSTIYYRSSGVKEKTARIQEKIVFMQFWNKRNKP